MRIRDKRLDAPIFQIITSTRWVGHGLNPRLHTRLYNAILHHQRSSAHNRLELRTIEHLVYTPDRVLLQRVRNLGELTLAETRKFLSKEGFIEL